MRRTALSRAPVGHFRRAKRTLIVLSLALAGCQTPILPTSPTPTLATIRLLAEPGTAPLLRELAANYHLPDTLIAWQIEEADWSTIQSWLAEGRASFALTAYFPAQSSLWGTPIGENNLAIVVNPANPVAALSVDQLRAIFTGRIVNWHALGGANQLIGPVSRPEGNSSAALFRSLILGNRLITGGAQLALSDEMVIADVAADRGAIGYLSLAALAPDANGIDTLNGLRIVPIDGSLPQLTATVTAAATGKRYPLRAPIAFCGLTPPTDPLLHDFFAWVQSPQGQAIVARHYQPLSAVGVN